MEKSAPLSSILVDSVYFITGIDTDCGKTFVTAYLSSSLLSEGCNAITQKLIQTGCEGISEDILTHRTLEHREITPEDINGTTCPIVYSYPCSPHMAAAIDGKKTDLNLATTATKTLRKHYEKVLIECAGGVMVPLTSDLLTVDYIAREQHPAILVTTARLGSISHTLLSLEVLKQRHITIAAVAYNCGISTDEKITEETRQYLQHYIQHHYPSTAWIEVPKL